MRRVKRMACMLLATVMTFTTGAVSASAGGSSDEIKTQVLNEQDYIVPEQTLNNMKWSIDSEGCFRLEGTGDFYYVDEEDPDEKESPLEGYQQYVKRAEVNIQGSTSLRELFSECSYLVSVDFSDSDFSNVVDMGEMFYGCGDLQELDLGRFDTSNVTDMSSMFEKCDSLIELDLSRFDTSQVKDMHRMFYGCSSLEKLDLDGWHTSNVNNMSGMFSGCSDLTELDLRSFETSQVIDMGHMFSYCSRLSYLDLKGFDMSCVTNGEDMFLDIEVFKIDAPCNVKTEILLPQSTGNCGSVRWKDSTGKVYTSLPVNSEISVSLFRACDVHPGATVDSVTWQGGLLEIPIDLKGYSVEDIAITGLSSKTLTDNMLTVSFVGGTRFLEEESFYMKKGTYSVTLEFWMPHESVSQNSSAYQKLCTDMLDLVVPVDSEKWKVSETLLEFDGSKDVTFRFQNGTNYCKLQSVKQIQVFTSKTSNVPYPVLTEGFQADMAAGTLTINKDVLKKAIKEYTDQGGYLGDKVILNVTVMTETGEEINYFSSLPSDDGTITAAWKLDVSKLGLTTKPSTSNPDESKPAPPKTVTLSSESYIYKGKVQKPTVAVKDSNGKTISAGNYTVSYAKGCKDVGRYTVTVKFKGNYTGSMTKTFDIKPKSTSISKVTAGKKSLTVKWKKQTKQTTGYQIQYSANKKFKSGNHTVLVNKSKTTQRKLTKLKAKKKYYVRIRTYKTVKINGKSTKIYSGWSKARSAEVKK